MVFANAASTRVILIGTSACPKDPEHLPPLPSVEGNINRLKEIFCDPQIGGLPSESVVIIPNPDGADDLGVMISRTSKEALDTLLLYYAGHGIKGPDSRGLFLATTNTTEEHCEFNGLNFDVVRNALLRSPARVKILIVDACFSGEITEDEMGSAQALVSSNIEVKGTYAIASSPANRKSIAPLGERYTAFSGVLIDVLDKGIEGGDAELSIDDVYKQVERTILQRPELPKPQRKVLLDADKVKIVRNRWQPLSAEERIAKLEATIIELTKINKKSETAGEAQPNYYIDEQKNQPKSDKIQTETQKVSAIDQILSNLMRSGIVILPEVILGCLAIAALKFSVIELRFYRDVIAFSWLFSPALYIVFFFAAFRASRLKIRSGIILRENFGPMALTIISILALLIWAGTFVIVA